MMALLEPLSVQGNETIGEPQRGTLRRLSFVVAFVLMFLLAVPLSGLVGLAALHLLAVVALIRLLWDAPRPTSEKATFKCSDCQYHETLDETTAWCVLRKQLAVVRAPACRELRLKVSAG